MKDGSCMKHTLIVVLCPLLCLISIPVLFSLPVCVSGEKFQNVMANEYLMMRSHSDWILMG
jgi:hypothetical protein